MLSLEVPSISNFSLWIFRFCTAVNSLLSSNVHALNSFCCRLLAVFTSVRLCRLLMKRHAYVTVVAFIYSFWVWMVLSRTSLKAPRRYYLCFIRIYGWIHGKLWTTNSPLFDTIVSALYAVIIIVSNLYHWSKCDAAFIQIDSLSWQTLVLLKKACHYLIGWPSKLFLVMIIYFLFCWLSYLPSCSLNHFGFDL